MRDDESAEMRQVYDALIAAWNRRDAEVRDHLEGIFSDHATASYSPRCEKCVR
jgi:hypothetical protein